MKRKYNSPTLKVIKLQTKDIIMTSGEEVIMPGGDLFDDLFN